MKSEDMNKKISLYIHVPFCMKKCLYCDFPSYCGKESLMVDYAVALSKEIRSIKEQNIISTVFIGGGTPTYLSLDAWKIIGEALSEINISNDAEFTIECNPGTVDEEKLKFFKSIGINRLSIGLQACQDYLLKKLGRVHNYDEFIYAYNLARKLGFHNINIDIMFGLPEQSMEQWSETLNTIINLKPEHISCYSLIIEEGTSFHRNYEKGNLNLPEEDVEREMYSFAKKILHENGYMQYEISNYSKTGRECKHNQVYWNLENYIGCGAAAHSYDNGYRYRNEENIEKYIQMIKAKNNAVIEKHKNSYEEEIEEFMFMGLRKIDGISEVEFENRFKSTINDLYEPIIKKYINLNLLERVDDKIFLNEKGIEVSNIIMSEFLLSK